MCSYNGYNDEFVICVEMDVIWEVMKFGLILVNCLLVWLVWCESVEVKVKLVVHVSVNNKDKILKVLVIVIIGMDMEFYENLFELFLFVDVCSWFIGNDVMILVIVFCNFLL